MGVFNKPTRITSGVGPLADSSTSTSGSGSISQTPQRNSVISRGLDEIRLVPNDGITINGETEAQTGETFVIGYTNPDPAIGVTDIEEFAKTDSNAQIQDAKIPSAITRDSEVEDFAKVGDPTDVPVEKIPGEIARLAQVAPFAQTGDSSTIPDNRIDPGILRDTEVSVWAKTSNSSTIPDNKIPSVIARDTEVAVKNVSTVARNHISLDLSGAGMLTATSDITDFLASASVVGDRLTLTTDTGSTITFDRISAGLEVNGVAITDPDLQDTPEITWAALTTGEVTPTIAAGIARLTQISSWARVGDAGLIPDAKINTTFARTSQLANYFSNGTDEGEITKIEFTSAANEFVITTTDGSMFTIPLTVDEHANVNSDWLIADPSLSSYIANKPTLPIDGTPNANWDAYLTSIPADVVREGDISTIEVVNGTQVSWSSSVIFAGNTIAFGEVTLVERQTIIAAINGNSANQITVGGITSTYDGTLVAVESGLSVDVTGGSNFNPEITDTPLASETTSSVYTEDEGGITTVAPGANTTFTRDGNVLVISSAGSAGDFATTTYVNNAIDALEVKTVDTTGPLTLSSSGELGIDTTGLGGGETPDTELSETSTNAVENRVVEAAIERLDVHQTLEGLIDVDIVNTITRTPGFVAVNLPMTASDFAVYVPHSGSLRIKIAVNTAAPFVRGDVIGNDTTVASALWRGRVLEEETINGSVFANVKVLEGGFHLQVGNPIAGTHIYLQSSNVAGTSTPLFNITTFEYDGPDTGQVLTWEADLSGVSEALGNWTAKDAPAGYSDAQARSAVNARIINDPNDVTYNGQFAIDVEVTDPEFGTVSTATQHIRVGHTFLPKSTSSATNILTSRASVRGGNGIVISDVPINANDAAHIAISLDGDFGTQEELDAVAALIGVREFDAFAEGFGVDQIVAYQGAQWSSVGDLITFDARAPGVTTGDFTQHSPPSDSNALWRRFSGLVHEDGTPISATARSHINSSHGLDLPTSAAVAEHVASNKAVGVRGTTAHATGALVDLTAYVMGNTQMAYVGGGLSNAFPATADYNASGFALQTTGTGEGVNAFTVGESYTTSPGTTPVPIANLDVFTCTRIVKDRPTGFDFYFFTLNTAAFTKLNTFEGDRNSDRPLVRFEGTTHLDYRWFIGADAGDFTFYSIDTNNAAVVTIDGVQMIFPTNDAGVASLLTGVSLAAPIPSIFNIEPGGTRTAGSVLVATTDVASEGLDFLELSLNTLDGSKVLGDIDFNNNGLDNVASIGRAGDVSITSFNDVRFAAGKDLKSPSGMSATFATWSAGQQWQLGQKVLDTINNKIYSANFNITTPGLAPSLDAVNWTLLSVYTAAEALAANLAPNLLATGFLVLIQDSTHVGSREKFDDTNAVLGPNTTSYYFDNDGSWYAADVGGTAIVGY